MQKAMAKQHRVDNVTNTSKHIFMVDYFVTFFVNFCADFLHLMSLQTHESITPTGLLGLLHAKN